MAFHETRFSTRIAYGSTGGPGFSTAINILGSGIDERIPRWATPKHRYDVAFGIKGWDDLNDLRQFYLARHGVANGFRFFDWMDHTTAANGTDAPAFDDQVIAVGDGSTKEFQLRKTYTEGSESRVRMIFKPIHGETIEGAGLGSADPVYNVLVGVNGSAVGSGWSVGTTTGVISFTTAPPAGQDVTAGFAFDVPVSFGAELDAQLPIDAESFDNADVGDIPLVEYIEPIGAYEDVNLGGAFNHGEVTAGFAITMLEGRVHNWADNTGQICSLPAVADTPLGGPVFYIWNEGTGTTSLREDDGITVVTTIPPDTLITVVLGLNASSDRIWYVV